MNQIPNIEEIEALSEKIHHLYCAQYEKDNGEPYWTKGDYSKLDERTKEYDRNIARFIHQQLQKARAEEKQQFGKILSEIEHSLKNSNGSKSEITGIIWTAFQALNQSQLKQPNV